jgi:hypothetical protein
MEMGKAESPHHRESSVCNREMPQRLIEQYTPFWEARAAWNAAKQGKVRKVDATFEEFSNIDEVKFSATHSPTITDRSRKSCKTFGYATNSANAAALLR